MPAAPEEGTRLATDDDLPRLAELAGAAIAELRLGKGGEVWARRCCNLTRYMSWSARASISCGSSGVALCTILPMLARRWTSRSSSR